MSQSTPFSSIVVPFKLQNLTFESDSTSVYLKNKQYYFTFVIMLMRILAYQISITITV